MPDQTRRDACPTARWSVTPDLWLKLYYKALTIEFEGIGDPRPDRRTRARWRRRTTSQLKLAPARAGWRPASCASTATRSSSGSRPAARPAIRPRSPASTSTTAGASSSSRAGDNSINDFHFSPDYHVDEILFRHILGTVTNAIYIKPQTAYWFDLGRTRALGLNGGVIYSMAQVPVSTPGNALMYGLETDVGAGYRNTAEGSTPGSPGACSGRWAR